MKRFFTLLLLLFTLSTFGQIAISPKTLALTTTEETDYLYTLKITNSGNTATTVWWRLNKSNTIPTAWATQTCDLSLCYSDNIDECPPNRGNVIPANSTVTFTIHLFPNKAGGSGKMYLQLFGDNGFKNLLAETDPNATVIADKTLDVASITSPDLKIYPNPATDFFVIKNDVAVARVGIYNIVGKEIRSYRHQSNYYYDVSDLNQGMYIVRLLDSRNKTLKSIRLSVK
jgi:hypothetical protein